MTKLHELRNLEARASGGDPEALYLMGMMYWTGRWIEGTVIRQDKKAALDMIQRAADFGHEEAASFVTQYGADSNPNVKHKRKTKCPDKESTNDPDPTPVKAAKSGEGLLPQEGDCNAPSQVSKDSWFYETVIGLKGNPVTRIRSSLFYWSAFVSFMLGIFLVGIEISAGGILILTLAPFLVLYPAVRFFIGGKDSIAGVVITFVIEHIIKREIFKALDDSHRNRRK